MTMPTLKEHGDQPCENGCLYCGAYHYSIVRMYERKRSRVIERGLSLLQAQLHCSDPESSSKTATSAKARRITARNGPWFDGYTDK